MDHDQQAMRLFEQATQLADDERSAFLDQQCGGDAGLRAYVDSLLVNLRQDDEFLSPCDLAPNVLAVDAEAARQTLEPSLALPSPEKTPQPGVVLSGRYRVVERLGSGGMGEVYRAIDQRLDREVAIKALHQPMQTNPGVRQRFEREIKAVAAITHPNIVTLHDIADHKGTPLAVMEHVAGRTLREQAQLGLSLPETLRIVRDVAVGLDAAHKRGVMHRDIKPENVMVLPNGSAKVLDFGLARQAATAGEQSLTATHQAPGTPPYMSPEQTLAKEVGCSTDIFSLGTVLFELIVGKNPFRAASAMETMQRISQKPTPDITDFTDALPKGLSDLVTSMLGPVADRRPSAREVSDRLSGFLAGSGLGDHVRVAGGMHDTTLAQHASATPPVVEPPTNLPLRNAELSGRAEELEALASMLTSRRIITVLGAGGSGKTSLAYEAARRARGRFPGGVWLCELAPLRAKQGVLEVLAGVLDGNAGAINTLEEVAARLDGEPTLVVLDNCEHVIDDAAEIVDRLSRQVRDLTVLTTSREALKISDECIVRLEGLKPDDAASLLVARAAEQGNIQEDSQLEDLVQQIVQQLEGLPLAIELAAPKLAVLTPSELLEALDNQALTLRSGRRSRGRQAAIDQAIAWSFDLLEPEERETLLALSVFTSWFTSEAAIEVSGLGPGVKIHLLRLVEQSVVSRKADGDQSRYRLLEPIRQFCQARIDADALEATRERHARYFARRAIDYLSQGVSGYDESNCLRALNAEWPDLREAIAWGRRHGEPGVAIKPCIAMACTAIFQLRMEMFQWLLEAEQQMPEAIATDANALATLANGHFLAGEPDRAWEYLDRARRVEATVFVAWTTAFLNTSLCNFEEGVRDWEHFRKITARVGNENERRWASCGLVTQPFLFLSEEHDRAEELLAEAWRELEPLDWVTGEAFYYAAHGLTCMNRGDATAAQQSILRCVQASRECGSRLIEYGACSVYSGAGRGLTGSPIEKLEASVNNLRDLTETGNKSMLPLATRAVVVALAECGDTVAAARYTTVVEATRGLGDRGDLNPEYQPAVDKLRAALGDERFEQLRAEGRQLSVADMLEMGTRLVTSQSSAP